MSGALFDARRDAPRLRGQVIRMHHYLAVRCPGPGHSARDDSLVVIEAPLDPEGFRVTSHAGDDWATCRDYVRELLGGGRFEPTRPMRSSAPVPARRKPENERPAADDSASALAIWKEAVEPSGTLVEAYLGWRGVLEVARPAFKHALRFHPRCPFGPGGSTPAMVALVRNVVTNEPQAIHRTALSRDGRNVEIGGQKRRALGPTRNGAVKLTEDAEVTLSVAVGEGLETTLSLRLVPDLATMPAWALLSSAGVAAFPVLPGLEAVWIAADHDAKGAGQKAAAACAKRWIDAGREAIRLVTTEPGDLNDLAMGGAPCRHST